MFDKPLFWIIRFRHFFSEFEKLSKIKIHPTAMELINLKKIFVFNFLKFYMLIIINNFQIF